MKRKNTFTKTNVLYFLRIREGLSQAELAAKTGLTANDICRIENGNIRCWIGKQVALAAHFGISVDALLKNDFAAVVQSLKAPAKTSRRSPERFAKRQAMRDKIGFAGEDWDYQQELNDLRGTPLYNAVNQNFADSESAGFDILSFTPDGRPRICEVKASEGGAETGFFISSAELETAKDCRAAGDLYELHRIYYALNAKKCRREIMSAEELLTGYDFIPCNFRAVPKKVTR